jgi:hypothetical protein
MAEYAKNSALMTQQEESMKDLREQFAEKKRTLDKLRKSAAQINHEGQIQDLSVKQEKLRQEISAAKEKLEPQLRALQGDTRPEAQEVYRAAQQKINSRNQESRPLRTFLASLETPEPHAEALAEATANAQQERDIWYREYRRAEERAAKAEEELRRIRRERGILPSSDQFQGQIQTAESFDARELADLRLERQKFQHDLVRARVDAVMEDRRERRALLSLPRIFDATEASSGGYIPDGASADRFVRQEMRTEINPTSIGDPWSLTNVPQTPPSAYMAPSSPMLYAGQYPMTSTGATRSTHTEMHTRRSDEREFAGLAVRFKSIEVGSSPPKDNDVFDSGDSHERPNAMFQPRNGSGVLQIDKRPGSSGIVAQQPAATRHKTNVPNMAQLPRAAHTARNVVRTPTRQGRVPGATSGGSSRKKLSKQTSHSSLSSSVGNAVDEVNPCSLKIMALVDGKLVDLESIHPQNPRLGQQIRGTAEALLLGYQDAPRRRHYRWVLGENSGWCYRAHTISFAAPNWQVGLERKAACKGCSGSATPCIIYEDECLIVLPRRAAPQDLVDWQHPSTWVAAKKAGRGRPRIMPSTASL